MSAKASKNQITAIIAVVFIALLGINAYLLYANQNKGDVIEKQQEDLTYGDSLRTELSTEYEEAIAQLEAKKGENEELNTLIEQQKGELKKQKLKIERMIRNGKNVRAELDKAKAQIQALIEQRDAGLVEINQLREKVGVLEENVTVLTTEKEKLSTTLEETVKSAEEEKEKLTEIQKGLEEEKEKLSEKVAAGSILKARDITIKPLKVRKSGKERDTKYARKADKLRFCFNVDDNKITTPGPNKMLLRILTPLGETLFLGSQGSGEFANQSSGGSVTRYSLSKGFDYSNEAINMCMDWNVENQLAKGEYTAEIYNRGHKVGEKKFLLK